VLKKLLSLASDALTYGASSLIGQLLNFLLLPLYTRHLSPADYGILAMLNLVTALVNPIASLQIPNAVMRYYMLSDDEGEKQSCVRTGFTSVLVTCVLLVVIATLALEPLTQLITGKPETAWVVWLAFLSGGLGGIIAMPESLLRADRRVKLIAVLNLVKLLLTVGLTIFMVVHLKLGVAAIMYAELAGGALLLVAMSATAFERSPFGFERDTWKKLASYGLPLLPHRVQASAMSLFGEYATRQLLGLEAAGLYSVAARFSMPIRFVVQSINRAWVPFKLEIHKTDPDPAATFRSIVTYYVAAVGFVWVVMALWGPELVRLMTAPAFHAAAGLVAVRALSPISNGLYFMMGTGFEIGTDTKPAPLISLAGLIVVVGGAYLFIPYFGAAAAALTTAGGWLVMAAMVYMFAQRRYRIHYDWPALLGILAMGGAVQLAAATLASDHLALRIAVAAILTLAFPLLVALVLLRSPTERDRLRRVLAFAKQRLYRRKK
jgi:O-antigen/teichoic acid export membrane protein